MAEKDSEQITRVEADIRYFEARLEELQDGNSARVQAQVQVYRLLLRQRRQLLAALQDGRPEDWPEYAPADTSR